MAIGTAIENSTFVITAAFKDEAGAAVVPNVITWTLTDKAGNVINSRDAVSVSVPATSIDIVLSGADLAVQASEAGERKAARTIYIAATYDSSAGSDLPLLAEETFFIQNTGA